MKRKNNVIFVAKDKGGFDSLLPVFKKIKQNKNFGVFALLDGFALQFAKLHNIKNIDASKLSVAEIEEKINRINPSLILTSTSIGYSIDKKVIKIAKKNKISTATLVDYWNNYKGRFGKNLEYLADYILAVDERMKKEIIDSGVSDNKIFITGNPRFDKFLKLSKHKADSNLIVFYSQPFSEVPAVDFHKFNEVEILKDIVKVLGNIYPDKKLIIKFHPSEKNFKKFDKIIKNAKIKIEIEKNLQAQDLNKKAGLVIGINSMALFDAVLMGKRVLSYQPGQSEEKDTLASSRYKWSFPVYKKSELSSGFKKNYARKLPPKKIFSKYLKTNATENIIKFITSL